MYSASDRRRALLRGLLNAALAFVVLASAPLLLERLATLSDRLTRVLDDENQESLKGILANSNRLTGEYADTAPQVRETMAELQKTLQEDKRERVERLAAQPPFVASN